MVKLGLIQTISYNTNQKGISRVSQILRKLGKKETEIVCLPEQWLKNNEISDFDLWNNAYDCDVCGYVLMRMCV